MDKREALLNEAKELGYTPPSNIGDETLENKVAEIKAQKEAGTNSPENTESTKDNIEGAENEATQTPTDDEQEKEALNDETTGTNTDSKAEGNGEATAVNETETNDDAPKMNKDGHVAGEALTPEQVSKYLNRQRNSKK